MINFGNTQQKSIEKKYLIGNSSASYISGHNRGKLSKDQARLII
jgi:hypothetical protein